MAHTIDAKPLESDQLAAIDAFWRAANYLSVGQIYLLDNPLLREPLTPDHIKPRLLGHWGTTPGLNLVYAHVTRAIREHDRTMMYVIGPGHGGPGILACTWLEGSYSLIYPTVSRDAVGMARLFHQFSFPGGVPSHVAAEVPGSIHEGGELGYSLSHAYGAAFDNPDLIVACVIGDGEAETGPLATSWHSNLFLDPARGGAVLPILHLNGYKIANPTVLARLDDAALTRLLEGYGYDPYLVEGDDPAIVHQTMAATVDHALAEIDRIQRDARSAGSRDGRVRRRPRWPWAVRNREAPGEGSGGPRWPMIVLRTPKGWTGPAEVDGKPVEGTWRAHQVPLPAARTNPDHLAQLETWLRSYRPEELFDADGQPRPQLVDWIPELERTLGGSPHANGGVLLRDLELPPTEEHAIEVERPGGATAEATRVLGRYLRDVLRLNAPYRNFRLFGPDETASNRLDAVYEVTAKTWQGEILPTDEHLAPDGRVMEILSEHTCQGWLEGYLLTGRHGLFSCYEAFVHIVDSMFNQHAKWLKVSRGLAWRRPIASLNYLLTSHVWRQDHNGFSHQDPGFIDHVVNKKADVIRVYLPPDANTLLYVAESCLESRSLVNVIVAGKNLQPVWLSPDEARWHCQRGIGIWDWASNDAGDPDVVLACAGDVPTIETLAAADLMRRHLPEVRARVVNVVDLMRLQPASEHPHGLPDAEFDALFTVDRPVIFAYHGYPWLIHRLTYRRANHPNLHVRGYKEEGTTTTPFDMVVRNDMDRYHLVMDVIDRVPGLGQSAAVVRQRMVDLRSAQRAWAYAYGDDPPEVRDWTWPADGQAAGPPGS